MNKEILDLALNTKNFSSLNGHTHYAKLKNRNCGDEIKVYLIIKKGKVAKLRYEGESCLYTKASANLLSGSIVNKEIKNIELLLKLSKDHFINKKTNSSYSWNKFLKIMNKGNILRKECLLLPIKATLKALKK